MKIKYKFLFAGRLVALLALFTSLQSCEHLPVKEPSPAALQRYLTIVYPTSNTIKQFTAAEAEAFYQSRNFWYRVPNEQNPGGLLTDGIVPVFDVFMAPDTVAVSSHMPREVAENGFTSDDVIAGSNRNYIEISSYGWSPFPYGAYYNWAAGSGIYVNTQGKTMHGFNKIDLLYRLSENNLAHFYKKLTTNSMVVREILGTDKMWNVTSYSQVLNDVDNYLAQSIVKKPNLLQALVSEPSVWNKIRAELTANDPAAGFRVLLEQYVSDHRSAEYSLDQPRYQYMKNEASTSVDRWLYMAGKKKDINVLQMTREPNSDGTTSFEMMDTRWPMISNENAGDDALIHGNQWFSLKYVWQKAIDMGWYQLRDPFDLNAIEHVNIISTMPIGSIASCDALCLITHATVDPFWLPEGGWNVKTCEISGGCAESTTIKKWIKLSACPPPLIAREEGCHLVNFGINAEGNGSFSITNIDHNRRLMGL
jgi:hypothetical protein